MHEDEDPIARMQFALLVEHDCICLLELRQASKSGQVDLIKEEDHCLFAGMAQCSVKGADSFKINQHASQCPHMLVVNKNMLEVSHLGS